MGSREPDAPPTSTKVRHLRVYGSLRGSARYTDIGQVWLSHCVELQHLFLWYVGEIMTFLRLYVFWCVVMTQRMCADHFVVDETSEENDVEKGRLK